LADAKDATPLRTWTTLSLRVPDPLLKDALVGEFSQDAMAGVWERALSPDDETELVFYFDSPDLPPLARARVQRVFERNGHAAPAIEVGDEGAVDWSLDWRKGFTAFEIGTRFRVVPSWEEPPADARVVLRIDPGMAFGTGTHETTRTVLELMERLEAIPATLDVGTGSGILSIAAVHLGSPFVVACDVDPDAVRVAADNCERNRVSVPVVVGSVDAVRTESVGLVLANLTADVIREFAADMRRVLVSGGHAIWSGVLVEQREEIEALLPATGFESVDRIECGEWVSWLLRTKDHGV
jgi:ribosomal protein L11 methyltransferase